MSAEERFIFIGFGSGSSTIAGRSSGLLSDAEEENAFGMKLEDLISKMALSRSATWLTVKK